MRSSIYIVDWVTGAFAIYLLWDFCVKGLLLDLLRDRLFELRFELFRLGQKGELEFGSPVYRMIETLLCGLLRFAHRISFPIYIFSLIEQEQAKKEKNYVDLSQQVALHVSRLDKSVQAEVGQLLSKARLAINLYMAFSSALFMVVTAVFLMLRLAGIHRQNVPSKRPADVIEREAYRSEQRRPLAA